MPGAVGLSFRKHGRLVVGTLIAWLALGVASAVAAPTNLTLQYSVRLGSMSVGRLAIEAAFIDGAYAIAMSGRTRGGSLILPSLEASMSARGTYRGRQTLPSEYQVQMAEGDVTATGQMAFRNRNVVDLEVLPGLTPTWDRVDLTMAHVRGVLDPISAMIVAVGSTNPVAGEVACNRTVPIFDGWQRFDLVLRFDREETVTGDADEYSGRAIVCSARYVPVAGHQPTHPPVVFMQQNERLEVWLMPVPGHPLLMPYQLIIGTEIGDLTIRLDSLSQH